MSKFSIFLSFNSFFLNKSKSRSFEKIFEFDANFEFCPLIFLELFILSFIKFLESVITLVLKLISLVCSGKLIFDWRSIFLSFAFVSSIFISYKTEFVSILFELLSFIFAGKFADASVIISF